MIGHAFPMLALLTATALHAHHLRSPLIAASPATGSSGGAAACPPVPPTVIALTGVSYYIDAQHSIADSALRRENERVQLPAVTFVDGVTTLSDRWRRSRGRDAASARCAAAWLDSWAKADAFRETRNVAGGYRRSWYLSGLAIAWLKVRDVPGLDPAERRRVVAWLADQAQRIISFYADPARDRDARNNHGDWAALAVAAAAVSADDERLFDWADCRFRRNLAEIGAEGALPLEVARGRRALQYHLFALTPLVLMSRFEAVNRRQYDARALARLEAFARAAIERPGIVARRAGIAQDLPASHGDPSELVWALLTHANDGPALADMLGNRRDVVDRRVGGDVRLTWPVVSASRHRP